MGFGPECGTALAGCEGTPTDQRHTGRQLLGSVKIRNESSSLGAGRRDAVAAGRSGGHSVACRGGRGTRVLDHPYAERHAEPEPCKDRYV